VDKGGHDAADQIRAIARLRKWRPDLGGALPRAALADSLALGYYLSPFQGCQFAASQTDGISECRRIVEIL